MSPFVPVPRGYPPIEDHGAIGNLRSVALVARDGTIDWCCLPEIDRPSVFGSILDRRRGGYFRVAPEGWSGPAEQRYVPRTNVLETVFTPQGGRVVVTDFMPLHASILGAVEPDTEPEIHRVVECTEGEAWVEVEWVPRFDYARARTRMARTPTGFVAASALERIALGGVPEGADAGVTEAEDGGPCAWARLRLRAGERLALVCRHGAERVDVVMDAVEGARRSTIEAWYEWVCENGPERWAGEWEQMVERSALALKLLTHPGTGAIAAAATTSLPERPGGTMNWDYRFSWIRDASMTVRALLAMGHPHEARDFVQWAARSARDGRGSRPTPQLVYGLHGETEFGEIELDHLEGYRGARPVRVGNWVTDALEHDIYAEMIGAAYEQVRDGGRLDGDVWDFLGTVADSACANWHEEDAGIWELKVLRHYVHSKWMAAVGLQRAVELAEEDGLRGDVERWRREHAEIRRQVLERGYDPELGAFTLAYDTPCLDAANLLMPMLGFLPAEDSRVQSTVDRTLERLTRDGHVYRYTQENGEPQDEGAFVVCTFWLVDALVLSGRMDEARRHFEAVAGRANHLGLFAEELDPGTGAFLGNFPQALSHIGFVNSALYLSHAEGRDVPSERHRVEREGAGA